MSDGYAIAAVTAVIRRTLLESLASSGVSDVVGTVPVTAVPPDRVITAPTADPTQINLFLHQVSRNAAYRNVDLPSRNAAGDLVAGPPLGLDLHYLLTVYGADMLHAEVLLGHAMRALHENAVLSREAVTRALSPTPPDPLVPAAVRDCGLQSQVELVKIVPEAFDSEEMSRLWSAAQAQYRPTAAFRVSVVLIEPRAAGAAPPAVRAPTVGAVPARQPRVDRMVNGSDPAAPVLADSEVVIHGGGFVPQGMTVQLGERSYTPAAAGIRSTTIGLDLGALTPAPRAGMQSLSVARAVDLGIPPAGHQAQISNCVPVAVRPVITASAVLVSDTETAGTVTLASGTLSVDVDPPVGRRQHTRLLLTASGGESRQLNGPPDNGAGPGVEEVTQVSFAFRRVPTGSYLLRVVVDGADSVLDVDGTGVYASPAATI